MASRPPQNFVIEIHLDSSHQFHYTDQASGKDVSSLVVIQGDTLEWVLHGFILHRTFQIDFDVVNPFALGTPVSLRGTDRIVAPPLKFPFSGYAGNRILKYTVSLANGWRDDPDIVPAPGDPTISGQLFSSGLISWKDPGTQLQIILTPPAMTADATGGGGLAKVTWSWEKTQPNPQPFSLQFEQSIAPGIPAGWPTAEQDSAPSNGIPSIQLFLGPGYNTATTFTLSTTTGNGNETSIQGTLLIS